MCCSLLHPAVVLTPVQPLVFNLWQQLNTTTFRYNLSRASKHLDFIIFILEQKSFARGGKKESYCSASSHKYSSGVSAAVRHRGRNSISVLSPQKTARMRHLMSRQGSEKVVQRFISRWLDRCNDLQRRMHNWRRWWWRGGRRVHCYLSRPTGWAPCVLVPIRFTYLPRT